jgi:hypothetical protein
MKRRAVIGTAVIAVLALVILLSLARQFRLAILTPAELATKSLTPPAPPDDPCAKIQRALDGSAYEKPTESAIPLSADDVAIYSSILHHWNSKSRGMLNVSNRTFPIDRVFSDCSCLKDIEPHSIANAARSFHVLTRAVLSGQNIRLVDASTQAAVVRSNDPSNSIGHGKSVEEAVSRAFSSGLFSLSEVAFDGDHRRALVSYGFVCGSLCGSGGVWLFEKVDGVWRKSEHTCGGWVS